MSNIFANQELIAAVSLAGKPRVTHLSFYYFRDSILPSFSIAGLSLSRYLRALKMILVYLTAFKQVKLIIWRTVMDS